MPPLKKRRVALPAKVGKCRQYLTDHFSVFPKELKDLKNGHILLQYIMNNNSATKTINAVMENLPCKILQSQLQSLLNQTYKFKNLRRDSDMEKYAALCSQMYTLFNPAHKDSDDDDDEVTYSSLSINIDSITMSSLPPVFGVTTFCIITGASRGLGREIALSLSALLGEKSSIVLTARSLADLEDTRKQLSACAPGLSVKMVKGDLGDATMAGETIASLFDGVDGSNYQHAMLIHNAGSLGEMSNIRDHSADLQILQQYYALNVTSCIALSAKFLKVFPKRDDLRRTMVAISSLCAIQATKSLSLYCSSKAARDMLMKNIAIEDPDTRVLNYAPGVLKTAMNQELITKAGDTEVREMMASLESTPYLLTPTTTCKALIKVLTQDTFESGAHIDYWDVTQ